jgi:phosphoheptose isomerase/phosphoglycolate phosphatase-like HAD superfamily hydrolase
MTASCYNGSSDPEIYAREISNKLPKSDFQMLVKIADEIIERKNLDRTIFTVGNGGSAATASHMVNDLIKGCRIGLREGFRAFCLNDPNAVITCLANDFSYEITYEILLRTLARRGDLLIVFSGSGNSPNILQVCKTARDMGITVVGFGGRDGGKMKSLCDYCMLAPTNSMEQIEDFHMFYNHSLVCHLRKRLETVWDMEVVHFAPEKKADIAIFDFDGTVSLLRKGWQQIMYSYFLEELLRCPGVPTMEEAEKTIVDFVDRLTGKQTIFQCIRLGEEVAKYGGILKNPLEYKTEYLHRLMEHIGERHSTLRAGGDCDDYLVPGVKETLKALGARSVKCYLTSGTDEVNILEEVELLGLSSLFESIHGATDANSTLCSKEQVLKDLIKKKGLDGSNLIIFGDGYVEIELAKQVGGYAVAVASEEEKRDTSVNEWKRERLLRAGADCVIPDFSNTKRLLNYIYGG